MVTVGRFEIPGYQVPAECFTYGVAVSGSSGLLILSGLTARDADGGILGVGDAGVQTEAILRSLLRAIEPYGAGPENVVRLTTYLMDMDDHPRVMQARCAIFDGDTPATTTVQVSRLFDERQLVEIEATVVT